MGVCALVMDDGRSGNDERGIDDEMGLSQGRGAFESRLMLSSSRLLLLLFALLGSYTSLCLHALYPFREILVLQIISFYSNYFALFSSFFPRSRSVSLDRVIPANLIGMLLPRRSLDIESTTVHVERARGLPIDSLIRYLQDACDWHCWFVTFLHGCPFVPSCWE